MRLGQTTFEWCLAQLSLHNPRKLEMRQDKVGVPLTHTVSPKNEIRQRYQKRLQERNIQTLIYLFAESSTGGKGVVSSSNSNPNL